MNKNIKIEIAVGIILVISLLLGGSFWLQNRKMNSNTAPIKMDTVNNQELSEKIQINEEFSKDQSHVYDAYKCLPKEALDKLDPQTFEVVNTCFVKDKNVVFFRPFCGQDCLYERNTMADPATLEYLTDDFLRDKNFVFNSYGGNSDEKIIKDADPKTFIVLGNNFSKDKGHVFYEDVIIDNADSSTFEVVGDATARDKHHTFSCNSDVFGLRCKEGKN